MKYLLFCCDSEAEFEAMDDAEREALMTETFEYADGLRESGQLLEGLPLESVSSAVTVRVRNGRPSTIDGPFAETKEQIGGFLLIEAKDFNEAIRIALAVGSVAEHGRAPVTAQGGGLNTRVPRVHDRPRPARLWRGTAGHQAAAG